MTNYLLKSLIALHFIVLFQTILYGQHKLSKNNLQASIYKESVVTTITEQKDASSFSTGIHQLLSNWNDAEIEKIKEKKYTPTLLKNNDTLIIGEVAGDSVVITGNWFHNGPIIIIGDGKLILNNANATIMGDVIVFGNEAKLLSNSSTIFFPQQYFYQRTLVAAGKGQLIFNQTHLDFSGLSHNFVATDSAKIIENFVTKNGFTTNGASKSAEFQIKNTNLAGEFICTDSVKLTFQKTKTILLWHHIPNGATFTHSFPTPDTVDNYRFSNSSPGIQNIHYSIEIDTCNDVMWAIMPTSGSTTTLSNSTLRAVGVWFENPGQISVSGLVNNSTYGNFSPTMSDKNLNFINSQVKTWNIYTFKESNLLLSNSIVGEIGSMGKSLITCQQSMIDGSGGYTWATDTTFLIVGYSSVTNDFRATKFGVSILSYSSLLNGIAMATDNAILIVNQSTLPEFPVAFDNSCVWLNKIDQPSSGLQNSIIDIIGSSYIEKSETSHLMGFAWYQLLYKNNNDTNWIPITERINTPVKNNLLGKWNTTNISPNTYLIKLVLCDNSLDSNKIEAIKTIHIQPSVLGVTSDKAPNNTMFYDNYTKLLCTDNSHLGNTLNIYSLTGNLLQSYTIEQTCLFLNSLPSGTYFAESKSKQIKSILKFVLTQ